MTLLKKLITRSLIATAIFSYSLNAACWEDVCEEEFAYVDPSLEAPLEPEPCDDEGGDDEEPCLLKIGGDVRMEFQHFVEKINGVYQRGRKTANSAGERAPGSADFDVEFNLYFDYKCARSWARAELQFDNSAGVERLSPVPGTSGSYARLNAPYGSGVCSEICLKKAYLGYNICSDDDTRIDIEVGRRRLYDIFDSRIQFLARCDGVVLRYATEWWGLDYYCNTAAWVVDERASHYAWGLETGFNDICKSGFDLHYSFVDWKKRGQNREGQRDPLGWRFQNSQFTFAYHFNPEVLRVPGKIYGGFLINHAATKEERTFYKRKNLGFYLGFIVGKVVEEGDWSFDMNYQLVQAQAVSDQDINGIGRGNVNKSLFTNTNTPEEARGNANYKGWKFEFLYAWTDSIQLDVLFQFSKAEDPAIGGRLDYSKFRLQAIYAF